MAAVFVSYKRENLAKVQLLVDALCVSGAEVWWDQNIAPDAPWEATIERELDAAKVVIVAWSGGAAASENVRAEARRARTQGKLLQAFVEACDPPLFFGERQGVDLVTWNGDVSDRRFQTLLAAVRAIQAGAVPPPGVGFSPKRPALWPALVSLLLLVSTALGFVSNLGGARDTVCSISTMHSACVDWAWISTDDSETATQARQRLLASVAGLWGRQDRDCSQAVEYRVARSEDGLDRITVRAPGYESVGQVIAAENDVIISRTTTPSARGAREQWEIRPHGDQMIVTDKDGVSTTLVRCRT